MVFILPRALLLWYFWCLLTASQDLLLVMSTHVGKCPVELHWCSSGARTALGACPCRRIELKDSKVAIHEVRNRRYWFGNTGKLFRSTASLVPVLSISQSTNVPLTPRSLPLLLSSHYTEGGDEVLAWSLFKLQKLFLSRSSGVVKQNVLIELFAEFVQSAELTKIMDHWKQFEADVNTCQINHFH